MRKQLAFTLLMVSIMGANAFAQDAPKSAVKKKDNKVKALPQAQPVAQQALATGSLPPAQKTGQLTPAPVKPTAPRTAEASHPKAQATQAPMQQRIPKSEVEPKK